MSAKKCWVMVIETVGVYGHVQPWPRKSCDVQHRHVAVAGAACLDGSAHLCRWVCVILIQPRGSRLPGVV